MSANDKTKQLYLDNPRLHLRHLHKFRNVLKTKTLGEQDLEWREELEFIIERTDLKISEIKAKIIESMQ